MARMAVRESVTLAGRAERARAARAFVSEVLGPGHPCGDDAVLLVSEVFGNSVRHSGSGAPGDLYERTGQPDVAYSECFGGARLIHDPTEISDLTTVMGMIRAAALSPRDSVALMRQIRRDLD